MWIGVVLIFGSLLGASYTKQVSQSFALVRMWSSHF